MREFAPGWDADSVRDLEALVSPLSNWGRWGPDDELGTSNLLTRERAVRAAGCVTTGEVLSLGRRVTPWASSDGRGVMHHMLRTGDGPVRLGGRHASDWLALTFHGFTVTHLDAPAHQMWGEAMYNGRASALVTASGAASNSVEPFASGLVGRGILLDAPRALSETGDDWLVPGRALGPDELDRIADACRVVPEPGDIVLVRTGRDALAAVDGAADLMTAGAAGLSASCLAWLRANDVALLGSDAVSDAMAPGGAPHRMPVHAGSLVFLGLALLDNLWLEDLASRCAENERWSFQAIVSPLRLARATGSPVNPVVVL